MLTFRLIVLGAAQLLEVAARCRSQIFRHRHDQGNWEISLLGHVCEGFGAALAKLHLKPSDGALLEALLAVDNALGIVGALKTLLAGGEDHLEQRPVAGLV